MTDEPRYTERDMILAKREAYAAGAKAWGAASKNGVLRAAREYPFPKITRPRVVRDKFGVGMLWRVMSGELQSSFRGNEWCVEPAYVTPERVALWADLLANPTEEVEV